MTATECRHAATRHQATIVVTYVLYGDLLPVFS
jgi:hypothetical protein